MDSIAFFGRPNAQGSQSATVREKLVITQSYHLTAVGYRAVTLAR